MLSKEEFIAFNRFGYGMRPEDATRLGGNPKAWLEEQLLADDSVLKLKSGYRSSAAQVHEFLKLRKANDREKMKAFRKAGQELMKQTIPARIEHAVMTDKPFLARLAAFWSNHFTVSAFGKPQIAGFIGAYENEAIRPHILGKFEDLLLAVTRHPAMLMYLDNAQSFGPNSVAGQRRGKGLNENLAREILELHTLGVDGGYTQSDVTEFAKVITGWTLSEAGEGDAFKFRPFIHEPGHKTVLGQRYGSGYEEGERLIKILANHPSTARFIARKLARHFIADEPDERDVDRLARRFENTGGDLRKVYEELLDLRSVWQETTTKFKTPHDFLISTMRLLGVSEQKHIHKSVHVFSLLNQGFYAAKSPAGWGDTEEDWLSPDAMMNRLEWVHAVTQRVPVTQELYNYLRAVMLPGLDFNTLAWIDNAPSLKEGVALILASPANQRR